MKNHGFVGMQFPVEVADEATSKARRQAERVKVAAVWAAANPQEFLSAAERWNASQAVEVAVSTKAELKAARKAAATADPQQALVTLAAAFAKPSSTKPSATPPSTPKSNNGFTNSISGTVVWPKDLNIKSPKVRMSAKKARSASKGKKANKS